MTLKIQATTAMDPLEEFEMAVRLAAVAAALVTGIYELIEEATKEEEPTDPPTCRISHRHPRHRNNLANLPIHARPDSSRARYRRLSGLVRRTQPRA